MNPLFNAIRLDEIITAMKLSAMPDFEVCEIFITLSKH